MWAIPRLGTWGEAVPVVPLLSAKWDLVSQILVDQAGPSTQEGVPPLAL